MPTYSPTVSREILERIGTSETMHNYVLSSVPQELLLDTDRKTIIAALFSLVIEHHGAILTLLRTGRFDGSACSLVRPLVDAVYRAFWVHFCAASKHLEAIRSGESPYPPLPNMADEVEKRMNYTGGLFTVIKPFIKSLHGYPSIKGLNATSANGVYRDQSFFRLTSMSALACCHHFSFQQAKIEFCRHINL